MTRLLRSQEHQVDSSNAAIVDQESAFTNRLIDLYGTPYPGSIGPGMTYAQGYTGPDTFEWFVVDRPANFIGTTETVTVSMQVATGVKTVTANTLDDVRSNYRTQYTTRTLTIQPDRYVQFVDKWAPGVDMGYRAVTGTLQQALLDRHQAVEAFRKGTSELQEKTAAFERQLQLVAEQIDSHKKIQVARAATNSVVTGLATAEAILLGITQNLRDAKEITKDTADASAEALPTSVGTSPDATSAGRGSIKAVAVVGKTAVSKGATILESVARGLRNAQEQALLWSEYGIADLEFNYEQQHAAFELSLALGELATAHYEVGQLATAAQRADANTRNALATGESILEERTVFRQRAAALIQGYRTKDVTFRTFRNEALEQYRSLFDLASRYTYLAAKSYDYETGLLGSAAGQDVLNKIVAARSLGDLAGGIPQATVSTLGDAGLAGTMARIQADWSVAKGRLGINNPDQNGTLFSLRRELFRLLDDPTRTDDEAAWQQTLEQHIVSNLLSDPDIATYCRNLRKPDGSAVPGIVIPFRTTITHGQNFFGLPLVGGDNAFSPSNYATKIYSVGMVLRGYVGMNPYSIGVVNAGTPATNDSKALSASPYLYLIPTGTDTMLSPPLGDTGAVREWKVADQALPLPFNLGATAFSTSQFYNANGTLSEQPWILRKHQAFRPVSDPAFFYSSIPAEFTNSRLVGRSAWNGGWKIVIPAYSLLASEQDGLNRFVSSVKDIELFLRTYSHSGN